MKVSTLIGLTKAWLGDGKSQAKLGAYYLNKPHLSKLDSNNALKWFRKAAANGDVSALTGLGYCSYLDDNVEAALRYYEQANEQGDAEAPYHIGLLYFAGEGVPEDLEKAFEYYSISAERKFPGAIHMIAWCYEQGAGVEPDSEKALSLWRKSAKYKIPESLCAIGSYYLKGGLVPQSNQEAYKWFYLAVENGDEDAPKEIEELSPRMTPLEVENAKNSAKEWNAVHS